MNTLKYRQDLTRFFLIQKMKNRNRLLKCFYKKSTINYIQFGSYYPKKINFCTILKDEKYFIFIFFFFSKKQNY